MKLTHIHSEPVTARRFPVRGVATTALTVVVVLTIFAASAHGQAPATQPAGMTHDPFADLPSYGDMIRRTAYTLLGILIAFILAAKYLPRLFGRAPFTSRGRLIQVIERHPLEPRKTIYLIKVADQYFLIASTPEGVQTLSGGTLDQEMIRQRLFEMDRPKNADSPNPRPQPEVSFTEVLRGK